MDVWSAALINIILFLSLGLLVRRSGQISLCHLAFAAVGAAAFGHFAGDGIPWLFSLILAALVAVPVGAVVAIPAVRVSGVFLALATLGFGILMEQVFYTRDFMFGQSPIGLAAPRPGISIGAWNLSTDTGFYYVLLIITRAGGHRADGDQPRAARPPAGGDGRLAAGPGDLRGDLERAQGDRVLHRRGDRVDGGRARSAAVQLRHRHRTSRRSTR